MYQTLAAFSTYLRIKNIVKLCNLYIAGKFGPIWQFRIVIIFVGHLKTLIRKIAISIENLLLK